MKKIIKEVLISPIFIICFSLSILALFINFFSYTRGNDHYSSHYHVEYCENIQDYDDLILMYQDNLEKLNPKDPSYEWNKKNCEEMIKIYSELKVNNIDYSNAYDYGDGDPLDGNIYLIKSISIVTIIVLINFLVVLYLVFTREFDSKKYVFIYEYTRYKTLLKKMFVIFLYSIVLCVILLLVNYLFSLALPHKFTYVVFVEDNVEIIKIGEYIFKDVIIFIVYALLFVGILVSGISLFVKKSIYTLLLVLAIVGIVALFSIFRIPLVVYLGFASINEFIPHAYYSLTYISIILPILFLGSGIYYFEKKDL